MKNSTAEKFETRSTRTGDRVFVIRCCNWSTSDLTEGARDAALARHKADFHPGSVEQRTAFYASVRAIEALCPACKQPQNAPSCERREHLWHRFEGV